ncbi:STAS domain-containing protein [Chitinivibrio alkaliphilus]|uniref:STAS domain-containing protein n=1 Tax=Chitinivibrio alkaliphilus TaxID=1505232 RepID=UPI000423D190|nr:STAS domain-containing protein [Chitinivibrio alkaliphilus]
MKYEVEERGEYLVIHVVGDITKKAYLEILDESISDHIDAGHHRFVFNLEKVEKIDLDGIDLFIGCLTDVTEHGGGVYIVAEDNDVLQVLKDNSLDKLIPIYETDEAFAADHGISSLD